MAIFKILLKEDPVNGIKDPRDYRYMKLLRFNLRCIGSWPTRELGEGLGKYNSALVILQMVIKIVFLWPTVMYIRKYSKTLGFIEIGHSYITILMSFVSISRAFTLSLNQKYRNMMIKFITKMHTFHHKDVSEFAMQTHIRVHKISTYLTIFLSIQMYIGIVLFNGIPMYTNYASGKWAKKVLYNETYDMSMYYELPFNFSSTREGYIFLVLLNWFECCVCSNFICMFDQLLSIMVFNVCGHWKILIHNLSDFPKPASTLYSCENNKQESVITKSLLYSPSEIAEVSKRLKACIKYHHHLAKFTQEISDIFGPMLFVYYIFHQISECLLLLECAQMDTAALMRYGMLTIVIFQLLIQLSFIIESVGTVTGLLKDAVYNIPWEHMDPRNRKIVAIFLMNVQEPLHINALGLAKIGVQSMAAILKTSFSYFAFLRSVSD